MSNITDAIEWVPEKYKSMVFEMLLVTFSTEQYVLL